jgi:hypothetical protein
MTRVLRLGAALGVGAFAAYIAVPLAAASLEYFEHGRTGCTGASDGTLNAWAVVLLAMSSGIVVIGGWSLVQAFRDRAIGWLVGTELALLPLTVLAVIAFSAAQSC